jgi:hypothetical protein
MAAASGMLTPVSAPAARAARDRPSHTAVPPRREAGICPPAAVRAARATPNPQGSKS